MGSESWVADRRQSTDQAVRARATETVLVSGKGVLLLQFVVRRWKWSFDIEEMSVDLALMSVVVAKLSCC